MVNCYLTTRGEYNPVVLDRIKSQSILFNLEIVSNVFENENKHECIAKSKEVCREMAEKSGCDFAIIHEDDCVELYPDNFENMVNFLLENESCGAVALRRLPRSATTHVCCGVIMIRKELLTDSNMFRGIEGHICYDLIKYFKEKNVGYCYLDDRKHIEQVELFKE